MTEGIHAHGDDPTAFGKYKEEQRTAWADKRVTVSVRRLGKRRAEVTSSVETFVENKPYGEASDEEELNAAIKDRLAS